ncbi:hypothetical protein [uncultured Nocardioides sp.]|nr:hypothetical protein [Nocardioides sp.]|tara:strand:- start:526 stop:1131 length:606 start_codon:yes stop_codon:yes gene_type:complete
MLVHVRRALGSLVSGLLPVLVLAGALTVTGTSPAGAAIEDFARYQPEEKCSPKAKPGAAYLSGWLVRKYGGGRGRVGAACTSSISEHQEGRAVDWSNDATTKAGRKRVKAFLKDVLAEDHRERPAAKARRMGIMYIIWNDQMYAAWRGFEPTDYLSSSCKRKKKCSKTLRHRDHVHISLSRQGGFGNTSFYEGRVVKKKKD